MDGKDRRETQEDQSMNEICVRCGKETEYDINTPIEVRRWYVEGAGQLCEDCWYKLWPTRRGKNNRNIAVETLRWKSNAKSNRAGLKS